MTTTKEKPVRTGTNKADPALNLIVRFANVTIGDGTARIGISIDRDGGQLTIAQADKNLCGRRLVGRVVRTKDGEDPNQKMFLKGERHMIEGSFDVKSFNTNPKRISFGLTFSLKDIAIEELGYFSKQAGRLIVDMVTSIPDAEDAAPEDDDEEEDDEEEVDDEE